jgi:hypothetical protein
MEVIMWHIDPIHRIDRDAIIRALEKYSSSKSIKRNLTRTESGAVKKLRKLAASTEKESFDLSEVLACLFSVNDGNALKRKRVTIKGSLGFTIVSPLIAAHAVAARRANMLAIAFEFLAIRRSATSKLFRRLIGDSLRVNFHHDKQRLPHSKIATLSELYQSRDALNLWDEICIKIVIELDDVPINKIAALREIWKCHIQYAQFGSMLWNTNIINAILDAADDGMEKAHEVIESEIRNAQEHERREREAEETRQRYEQTRREYAQQQRDSQAREQRNTRQHAPKKQHQPRLFQDTREISKGEQVLIHDLHKSINMYKEKKTYKALLTKTTLQRLDSLFEKSCLSAKKDISAFLDSGAGTIENFMQNVRTLFPRADDLFSVYDNLKDVEAFATLYPAQSYHQTTRT